MIHKPIPSADRLPPLTAAETARVAKAAARWVKRQAILNAMLAEASGG